MGQHKTPLRYPGGKQRLAPFFIEIINANHIDCGHYVEPYAGGAGIAIELLLSKKVGFVHLNDCSRPIFAFWWSILNRTEEFCKSIASSSLTVDEWKSHRSVVQNSHNQDLFDLGYSTFYLNRCNRSGVLSGGLIGGLSQTGKWTMDARFSRSDLIRRVEAIAKHKESIFLSQLDAEIFIKEYITSLPSNTLVYCDPPYFEKASRLYLNHYKKQDHARIAEVIQTKLERKWIVSYDSADEIVSYYKLCRYFHYDLQYHAARAYKGKEILVFSDDMKIPDSSVLSNINFGLSMLNQNLLVHA